MTTTEPAPTNTEEVPVLYPEIADRDSLPTFNGIPPADGPVKARIAGTPEAMTIPFGIIDIATDNVRDAASTDIASLAKSIARNGLIQAIAVEPHPHVEGRWLVAAGHRRWLALHALGLGPKDPVPVTPLGSSTLVEGSPTRVLRMLAENVDRENLRPMDEAKLVARLVGVYEMTHQDVAEQMNWNRKTVALRLALLELPADAQDLVDSGDLPLEGAQEIGRLIRDGAPTSTVNRLIEGRANFNTVQVEWTRWRAQKLVGSVVETLESRGFAVATSFAHVATRSGYDATGKESHPVSSIKEAKQFDPRTVKTLKEPTGDRRPVLVVTRDHAGAVVWTVTSTKRHTSNRSSGEPMEWEIDRAARDTMVATRMAKVETLVHDAGERSPVYMLQIAVSAALAHFPQHRVEQLSQLIGKAPVLDEAAREDAPFVRRLRWPATVEAWVDEADTQAKLKFLLWAVALVDAAHAVAHLDGEYSDGPESIMPHYREAIAAGIGPIIPTAEWSKVTTKVAKKLKEQQAAKESE